MTQCSSYMLSASQGISPSVAGAEVPNSRRIVYVADAQFVRVSYAGGGLGDCAVGLAYSLDGGTSWGTLIEYGPSLSTSGGLVLSTDWTPLGELVWGGDLLVVALARGAALSLGLLYQLQFVELQVR